eukprot:11087681-Alexandrium_andersonii.AAC.1
MRATGAARRTPAPGLGRSSPELLQGVQDGAASRAAGVPEPWGSEGRQEGVALRWVWSLCWRDT